MTDSTENSGNTPEEPRDTTPIKPDNAPDHNAAPGVQATPPYTQPAAYPTDAFGRPIPGPDGSTPIYNPTPAQQQAYASANANGYAPPPPADRKSGG